MSCSPSLMWASTLGLFAAALVTGAPAAGAPPAPPGAGAASPAALAVRSPAGAAAGLRSPSSPLARLRAELTAEPQVVWPAGAPHPTVLAGLRPREPEAATSPEGAALGFLARHRALLGGLDPRVDLEILGVRAVGSGQGVSLRQVHRGVPVEGRGAWVWVGGDGRIRAARITPALRPDHDPTPALDRAGAEALAQSRILGSPALHDRFTTRLVYFAGAVPWAAGAPPRLAWEVHPWPHSAFPADRYLYIDARTGELLLDEDRVAHYNQARAFPQNPVVDGWATEAVQLDSSREAGSPLLISPWVEALACLDEHQTVEVDSDYGPQKVHVCTISRVAEADAAGDFIYEPDYLSPRDPFAEVHGFYHTHRAFEHFASLGLDELDVAPIQVVVNYMGWDGDDPDNMSDPYGALKPVTNAYFTSGSVLGEEDEHPPRIQFGQGADADVVYDADVLYHEFGHAVVSAVDGPRRTALGPWGISNEGPAINEASADFFSSSFTGDPIFAEYASYDPDDDTPDGWRDLVNDYNCIDDVAASAHNDGRTWAGALWGGRAALPPEDQRRYDVAYLDTLRALGPYSGFADAATLTLALVRDRLGDDAAAPLKAELERRHLFACARWRRAEGGPRSLSASSPRGLGVTGPGPGTLQLIVPVSQVGGDLVVRGTQRRATGLRLHVGGYDAEPNAWLRILARWDEPIAYAAFPGIALGIYDADVPVLPTGNVDVRATSDYLEYEARIPIDAPGEVYVMLGSAGDSGGGLSRLSFSEEAHKEVADGPQATTRPTLSRTHLRCALTPPGAPPGAAALLALLAVVGRGLGRGRARAVDASRQHPL